MQTNLVTATNSVWAGLQGIAVVTPSGLEINERIDIDDFRKAFNLLLFLDEKYKVFINFALGDLYNSLDLQHGEKKAQIIDTWGLSWYQRLNSLGKIAMRVSKSCRHDYQLPWHVYESAGQAYVPEEVRYALLETAAQEKGNGNYVKREDIRDTTSIYKPVKKKTQPAWNGGNGGKFGDAADAQQPPQAESETSTEPFEAEVLPTTQQPRGGDRNESTQLLPLRDATQLRAAVPNGVAATAGGIGEGVRGEVEGGISEQSALQDRYDRLKAESYGLECDLEAEADRYKDQIRDANEEIATLRARVGTLESKLAGNLLQVSDFAWELLGKELSRRQLNSPHDLTLDRDAVGEDCLLRGIKEASRKR